MRLPDIEHVARNWRIHQIAPDFRLEDVWAFSTPGAGPDDFPAMLDALRAAGGLDRNTPVVRFLFAVRWRLGALFGVGRPTEGFAGRVESLCDRLPADLRQDGAGEPVPNTPFTMVYELPDECAVELANKTVHDICHLGWVQTTNGDYQLRMAALVKPNGLFGRLYMAAIKPFRYLIVYPALTRQWEAAWRNRDRHVTSGVRTPPAARSDVAAVPFRARDGSADAASREAGPGQLTRWAGRLIVAFGAAHTVGALTVEGAARHAGAWLRGELRGNDLADMSPANSAYWLSVMSFGPPLVLLGSTVLWLERRGISPPAFIAWTLGVWTAVDTFVAGPGKGQGLILASAVGLLLADARRAARTGTSSRLGPALSA